MLHNLSATIVRQHNTKKFSDENSKGSKQPWIYVGIKKEPTELDINWTQDPKHLVFKASFYHF